MKEFMPLYKTSSNDYCNIKNQDKLSTLQFLLLFFSGDYILNDTRLFTRTVNFYNVTFIYNNFINKMLYIGLSSWELNEEVDAPSNEEFPDYINESNTCKISYENFIEFSKNWLVAKASNAPFALIYRNNNDWIDFIIFQSQEAMQLFIADQSKQTEKMSSFNKIGVRDPEELDQMHVAIPYSIKINNFLEVVKPYFTDINGKIYFVEAFSSMQIHAGDYSIMNRPRGGHSNFGGHKLDYFNPLTVKIGYLNSKDMLLRNSRFPNLIKFSYVYPESWSEYLCDLKAIEALISDDAKIFSANMAGVLKIVGHTSEELEIILFYEIKTQIIRMHYPNI